MYAHVHTHECDHSKLRELVALSLETDPSQVWGHTPIIPPAQEAEAGESKTEASLKNLSRPCLKTKKAPDPTLGTSGMVVPLPVWMTDGMLP